MSAQKFDNRSFLTHTVKKLQRQNPVVSVYEGHIDAHRDYNQPVVFFNTGVVGVLRDQEGRYGLIKIWRHTPLKFTKKNTFPIFPDVGDLGIWSWECVRGGVETYDKAPVEALRRELQEEIGAGEGDIVEINELGKLISNTAIDVYHSPCFEVVLKSEFKFECQDEMEAIAELKFFEREELKQLIADGEMVCGISQGAVLQAMV